MLSISTSFVHKRFMNIKVIYHNIQLISIKRYNICIRIVQVTFFASSLRKGRIDSSSIFFISFFNIADQGMIKLYLNKHNVINPLSAKFIKWSNTLKQIIGKLPTICLSVFDHFSGLALKGLTKIASTMICACNNKHIF